MQQLSLDHLLEFEDQTSVDEMMNPSNETQEHCNIVNIVSHPISLI